MNSFSCIIFGEIIFEKFSVKNTKRNIVPPHILNKIKLELNKITLKTFDRVVRHCDSSSLFKI